MNRYTRDQLIVRALAMVQSPNLEVHDAPDGVVQPNAFSIGWLQDIIDFWHHIQPFSSTVVRTTLNATANSDEITLPSDFILDVRNGYLVQTIPGDSLSYKRRMRLPFQKWLSRSVMNQNQSGSVNFPDYYCILGTKLKITPTPTVYTLGYLWYYQLPAVLEAGQKPKFPNDYVCTEYIRIRALEWMGAAPPGTAQTFCDKLVASLKSKGLMNEPEDDEVPFDDLRYRNMQNTAYSTYSWMGPV